MKLFIATIIGSCCLAGYGMYDAYRNLDCPNGIARTTKQLIEAPTGAKQKVVIDWCK